MFMVSRPMALCHCPCKRYLYAEIRTVGISLGLKLQTEEEEAVLNKKRSKKTQQKYEARKKDAKVETALEDQFATGKLMGM